MKRPLYPRIIFPSGAPDLAKVNLALDTLKRDGITASCPLLQEPERLDHQPSYLCGSDDTRANELLAALGDPEVEVIWCGRGGYGATRLLSQLNSKLSGKNLPMTTLAGYSDITALFAFIRTLSLPIHCLHAPVLTEYPHHPQPQIILDALSGKPQPIPLIPSSNTAFHGPIWGGNLAVLASLCGTPWLPHITEGAILLEDIEEAPYRLDRFITQLHDNKFFSDCCGVFLGQFTRCGQGSAGLNQARQCLDALHVPVLGELPVGHDPLHYPLALDRPYRLHLVNKALVPQF